MVVLVVAAEDLKSGDFCYIGGSSNVPMITFSSKETNSISLYDVEYGEWAWVYVFKNYE